jgi:hypothetical protein
MRLAGLSAVVVLSLAAGTGCRTIQRRASVQSREEALSPHPVSVSALRYRTWVGREGGGVKSGYFVEALWFPEWKLEAWTYVGRWTSRTRVAVVRLEEPREGTDGTVERVEVPWPLAERIHRLSGTQDQMEDERHRLGSDLRGMGLLRTVPAREGG